MNPATMQYLYSQARIADMRRDACEHSHAELRKRRSFRIFRPSR